MNFSKRLNKLLKEAMGEGSIEDLKFMLQPSDRVILSPNLIGDIKNVTNLGIDSKPNVGCLWYGFGASWLNFSYGEDRAREECNYVYELIPDGVVDHFDINSHNKILSINNPESYKLFRTIFGLTKKQYEYWQFPKIYGGLDGQQYTDEIEIRIREKFPAKQNDECVKINWDFVKDLFSGVEIDYSKRTAQDDWARSWDVSSGCIWNKAVVKELKLIFKPEDLKYENPHEYSDEKS